MDIRRLQRIQNQRPAQIASRRKWRNTPRLPAETPSLNALLAELETGRGVSQIHLFTSRTLAGLWLLTVTGVAVWEMWAYGMDNIGLVGYGLLLWAGTMPSALRQRADKERQRAILQLTGYDDLRAIAPLTEGLFARDRHLRVAASIALTRLLPRLQAQDSGLLASPQRKRLYRCLSPHNARRNPELACAVRQGLQHIGDKHTLVVESSAIQTLTPNT